MYIDVKRKRRLTTIEFQNQPGRYIISLCIDDTPKKFILVSDLSLEEIKTGSLVGIEPRVTYLKPALQLNTSSRRLMSFQIVLMSIDDIAWNVPLLTVGGRLVIECNQQTINNNLLNG